MGMDLKPINPSANAPRHSTDDKWSPNEAFWGRYNWSGWSYIIDRLNEWGVDTSTFAGCNDGAVIPDEVCKQVADAIEKNAPNLDEEHRDWLLGHVLLWRTCGGYEQH